MSFFEKLSQENSGWNEDDVLGDELSAGFEENVKIKEGRRSTVDRLYSYSLDHNKEIMSQTDGTVVAPKELGITYTKSRANCFKGLPNFFSVEHQEKRQKYMPRQRLNEDLFDDIYQISEGPEFNEQFGAKIDGDISVTGGDGKYVNIESFRACGLSSEILNNLRKRNYSNPLPIQKVILPLVQHKKYDIVAHAQTGSGKTAAFLLPIINQIDQYKRRENIDREPNKPYAIIVAPSRELVQQITNDARSFAEDTKVRVSVSYGDMPVEESIRSVKYGCDIFVATFGRLIHFIEAEYLKLDNLNYFILDEADKLLTQENFYNYIKQIKDDQNINESHRTFMFSATFGPEIIEKIAEFVKKNYLFIRIGELNRAVDTVKQIFLEVTKYKKSERLLDLLLDKSEEVEREDGSSYYKVEKTIVFVEHRRHSDFLAIRLAQNGYNCISINGDRTARQRTDAADKFIKGIYNILVATDVAARGLNFPKVEHVINYDLPHQDNMSYIHRIGRSGRTGNVGRATSFFDPESPEDCSKAAFYIETLKNSGQFVPEFLKEVAKRQETSNDVPQMNRRWPRNY